VPVELTPSAYKHGFDYLEALHVLEYPIARVQLTVGCWLFLGYPSVGSNRPVELLAEIEPPRTIKVFHVFDLTDKYADQWPGGDPRRR
jgi:hypothetical protein